MEADPLAQLRDIHLPEQIGWWPLAPGWWLLALLTIAAIFFLGRKHLLQRQRNRYRQTAGVELQSFNRRYGKDQNVSLYLADTQKLLRRVALHRYPDQRRKFASLSGEEWLQFLNSCCNDPVFTEEHSPVFVSLPYQKSSDYNVNLWKDAVARWLEQHR